MDQPPQLQTPATFYLRELIIWPLIVAKLVYSLFPNPLLSQVDTTFSQLTKFLFFYLTSLFAFPLLSAIAFTHFLSLKRLFVTHLWVSLAMVLYNAAFLWSVALSTLAGTAPIMDPVMSFAFVFIILTLLRSDDASLWRLASLPEPDYGAVAALLEERKLVIWGVNGVFLYLRMCNGVFKLVRVLKPF